VVCPKAEIKLFVTATPEVRAERRFDEIVSKGGTADLGEILADLKKRDARDTNRTDSPLRPAEDAHLLDTSEMSIEAAFLAAKNLIDEALARHKA
jgi:cytidylate kinase